MDAYARTRVVNNTLALFIQNPSSAERWWVFRNLGPTKIVITGTASVGQMSPNELRPGDFVELHCQYAQVILAQGETDPSVLQWMPVP